MKNLALLILILISGLGISQTPEQKKILDDAHTFLTSFEKKDYGRIIEMTHPAILEKFDRETLENAFRTLLEGNDEMKISISNVPQGDLKISDIFETGDRQTKYVFVTFPMTMNMTFLKDIPAEEAKKLLIKTMEAQGMKASFSSPSVLELKTLSMTIGINGASTKNEWKYINHDEGNPFYRLVMPEEIARHARNFNIDILKQKENAN